MARAELTLAQQMAMRKLQQMQAATLVRDVTARALIRKGYAEHVRQPLESVNGLRITLTDKGRNW